MRQFKILNKRFILGGVFCVQLILLITYCILNINIISNNTQNVRRVSFFTKDSVNRVLVTKHAYQTCKDRIILELQLTGSEFIDFNTSICYKNGTDIKLMLSKENKDKWNCKCLPNFHGNNCGQPEIIWRALLNFRKQTSIRGPRKYKRNILFIVFVDKFLTTPVDIMVNELNTVVDLFILYEYSGNFFLKNLLNSGFIKMYHKKILYLNVANENDLLSKIQNSIQNLKQNTLIAFFNNNEILNIEGLKFLKLYDGWPEPLVFRLRWSVYGYFWLHWNKTILKSNVFTLTYLNDNWEYIKKYLFKKDKMNKLENMEFIIGDLNHYGGWFCQYCYDAPSIIDYIITKNVTLPQKNVIKIDEKYMEDLIDNGLYVDGKTELERVHRSSEHYYAPHYVIQNKWDYDWLLKNIYSRLDY